MPKTSLLFALGAALVLTGLSTGSQADSSTEVISIGTLAPPKSAWGTQLDAWAKEVKKKSDGELVLEISYNGSQGDESTLVAKMGTGQLDGALLWSPGLSEVHQPIAALTMPRLFKRAAPLNAAIGELMPAFKKGARKNGFVIAGIQAGGKVRLFSKGAPIDVPSDLGTMKVFGSSSDVTLGTRSSVLGYTPVKMSTAELLSSLSSGRVNAFESTALMAEQLQWAPNTDHVHTQVVSVDVIGLVLSRDRMSSLPPELKKLLLNTGRKRLAGMCQRGRKRDAKAFERIKNKATVVERTGEQRAEWRQKYAEVRQQLRGTVFSESLVDQLESLAGSQPQ